MLLTSFDVKTEIISLPLSSSSINLHNYRWIRYVWFSIPYLFKLEITINFIGLSMSDSLAAAASHFYGQFFPFFNLDVV